MINLPLVFAKCITPVFGVIALLWLFIWRLEGRKVPLKLWFFASVLFIVGLFIFFFLPSDNLIDFTSIPTSIPPPGPMIPRGNHKEIQFADLGLDHPVFPLESYPPYVFDIAFSPDGKRLTSVYYGNVTISELATGRKLRSYILEHRDLFDPYSDEGPPILYEDLTFSPGGEKLISQDNYRRVLIWDLNSEEQVSKYMGDTETCFRHLSISPDGRTLAGTGPKKRNRCRFHSPNYYGDTIVMLWDFNSGNKILRKEFLRRKSEILPVPVIPATVDHTFSPDSKLLAVAREALIDRYRVTVWDTQTGDEVAQKIVVGHVTDLDFAPDGRLLATIRGIDEMTIWDVTNDEEVLNLDTVDTQITFSPDGKILASHNVPYYGYYYYHYSEDYPDPTSDITLWDASSGKKITTFVHDGELYSLDFSPDGKIIASTGLSPARRSTVYLWDVPERP